MTSAEVLQSLSVTTPAAIFPQRAPFGLAEGALASFIAFNRNPLEDLESIPRVSLRVKGRPGAAPRPLASTQLRRAPHRRRENLYAGFHVAPCSSRAAVDTDQRRHKRGTQAADARTALVLVLAATCDRFSTSTSSGAANSTNESQ